MKKFLNNSKKHSGFTMIEVLIGALILVIVIALIYRVMLAGIQSSVKGQQDLDSIRTAGKLLNVLRKDVLTAKFVESSETETVLEPGQAFPEWNDLNFTSDIMLVSQDQNISYHFNQTQSKGKQVKGNICREVSDDTGKIIKTENFGDDNIREVGIAKILLRQKVCSDSKGIYNQGFLVVRIKVAADEERLAKKEIDLISILAYYAERAVWNRYYEPEVLQN